MQLDEAVVLWAPGDLGDPSITLARQKRLSDILGDDIIKVLSLGYSPEEAEATFYLQLARWREERQKTKEKLGDQPKSRT